MKNPKSIQTLQELAQNLRADYYYFVCPHSVGDTYRLLIFKSALEQKWQGRIIFIVKPAHKPICEMFKGLEYVICESKSVDFCRDEKCLMFDNIVSTPTLGKIYSNYTDSWFFDIIDTRNFIDWDRMRPIFPQNAQRVLPTNLPKISESLRAKLNKIAPLDKIILFCPEANSFPKLPFIIFKDECQRLRKEGYSIVVNTLKYKKEYARFFIDGVYDLDLSLKEAIALGISCAGVISTRAGFCDIVAPHCKNLKIYYTLFDGVLFWSFRYDDTLKVLPKEVLIYDTSIYKRYLRAKSESLPLILYKRYATKGFLRKLRLPFTAYFKIYRRYKKEALQDFSATNFALKDFSDKEMSEFIEQELIQTYEYQLGLALQKACERFWWGGFLAFPFAYLKIRKEKGKRFVRMSEIL